MRIPVVVAVLVGALVGGLPGSPAAPTSSDVVQPVSFASRTPAPVPTVAAAPVARVFGNNAGVSVVLSRGGVWRVFGIGADGAIHQQYRTASGWSAPESLGGSFRAAPGVVYRASDHRFDVFAVDTRGRLMQRTFTGRWGRWTDTGVRGLVGAVSAVRDAAGSTHVFGTDAAHRVSQAYRGPRGWTGLQRLGLVSKGNVAVVYTAAARRYDLFAVDGAGRIRQRYHLGGRWSAWATVSKAGFSGQLTAVRLADRQYRVLGRGTNGQLYQVSLNGHWRAPERLGGNLIGVPGVAWNGRAGIVVVSGANGRLAYRSLGLRCCAFATLPGAGYPKPAPTRYDLARLLIGRWGGRLTGRPGVLADLRATAAGRPITACGSVHLDTRLLAVLVRATDRYQVNVNNLVTGHSCDSGEHPRGRAVDFNTIVDPATGRHSNWRTGTRGDNQALDAEFLTYVAAGVRTGGGAGQSTCAGSARAKLPPGFLRFWDSCNHQHLDVRPPH